MGIVKICVHELAKNPYYVESTGLHLYSLEELAYYLYENIYSRTRQMGIIHRMVFEQKRKKSYFVGTRRQQPH